MAKKSGAKSKSRKRKPPYDATTADLPLNLQTADFIRAWFQWVQYRTEAKKRISQRACSAMLNKLASYGPVVAVKAIHRAMENDWQGLFPEREAAAPLSPRSSTEPLSGIRRWAENHRGSLGREHGQ